MTEMQNQVIIKVFIEMKFDYFDILHIKSNGN